MCRFARAAREPRRPTTSRGASPSVPFASRAWRNSLRALGDRQQPNVSAGRAWRHKAETLLTPSRLDPIQAIIININLPRAYQFPLQRTESPKGSEGAPALAGSGFVHVGALPWRCGAPSPSGVPPCPRLQQALEVRQKFIRGATVRRERQTICGVLR